MSTALKKRIAALEAKRTTVSAYTFQEMHKIQCTVVLARFKALYEPQPERGQP